MPLSQQDLFAALSRAHSPERLAAYRCPNDDDAAVLARYLWNTQLGEALYPTLQALEVALRNSVHAAITRAYGRADWYDGTPPILQARQQDLVAEAKATLRAAGKLGLVHFQFPPWVTAGAAGRVQVEHCVERMAGHDLSVEFRHRSWFVGAETEATLAFLREMGVAHTVVDGPQGFSNSVPAVWEATHPRYALLRLHGRNTRTWNMKGATTASDRFNYDYPESELADLVPRLERLALTALQTHVIFNNNMEDQGQRNARTMVGLIAAHRSTS